MTTPKSSAPNKSIELIKQLYSALNRNDIEAALELLDPNIIRSEFIDSPNGGTYRGLAELKLHIINGRNTWAEGTCEPIEFFAENNKFVVIVHVKVRLKNETTWVDAQTTDGFLLKDDRVAEFHSFTTKQKAFDWARESKSES